MVAMFETLGLLAVSLVLGFAVVWPAMKRAAANAERAREAELAPPPHGRYSREAPRMPRAAAPTETDDDYETLDLDRIEGRVKKSSMKRVGDIVERHPGEAASVLRRWMNSSE